MLTLNQKIEQAKDLIVRYTKKHPNCAFSYSGGKDSEVLMHLAYEALGHYPTAFTVLSDTEFDETEEQVANHPGAEKIQIFRYKNENPGGPDCCRSKKVETFKTAVKDINAWFAGIRRDEGITRADFQFIEVRDDLIKVNPILSFTETDIWRYLATRGIKVNPQYQNGYRSLSCKYCSVVEKDGAESERAGRWKGTEHEGKECGIHTQSLRA